MGTAEMAGKKLTVVQMLPALEGGGVERGTLEVARALMHAGHRSIVISAGGRMVEQLLTQGSEHLCRDVGHKSLFTARHIWFLRRYLQENQVDILHLRSRLPAWIGYLAWKGMPVGQRPHLVTTVHGLYSVKRYSAIMNCGEKVIAVSETVRKYLVANYPRLDQSRVVVIPRGIDADAFPYGYQAPQAWLDSWYQEYPQLKNQQVLTLPGRITRLKGHHDFIDLIATLHKSGQRIYGIIVGGEDKRRKRYAEEVGRHIADAGLNDYIVMTGARFDIKAIYSVSDIVLSLSSKPESFGRSVLEALSLGRPVVGYDYGGAGELLRILYPHGGVPSGQASLLPEKVMGILQGGSEPVADGHPYELSVMLDTTISLYESLCDTAPDGYSSR